MVGGTILVEMVVEAIVDLVVFGTCRSFALSRIVSDIGVGKLGVGDGVDGGSWF
jgi:hypothetical protein